MKTKSSEIKAARESSAKLASEIEELKSRLGEWQSKNSALEKELQDAVSN